MIRYLLDTNVVSELTKPKPHQNVVAWLATVDDGALAISAMTIREIAYGVDNARKQGSVKAAVYAASLEKARVGFAGRILTIDEAVALKWAALLAEQNKDVDDRCMVATAAVHGLVLVTRNEDHTSGLGVEVLNPFKASKGG